MIISQHRFTILKKMPPKGYTTEEKHPDMKLQKMTLHRASELVVIQYWRQIEQRSHDG
jgi:hypothetical protein